VFDGLGLPARELDVAVLNGRIAAIGARLAAGRDEIDARSLAVAPGSSTSIPTATAT
jgi:N-acyl-D-amino-acid deacylase